MVTGNLGTPWPQYIRNALVVGISAVVEVHSTDSPHVTTIAQLERGDLTALTVREIAHSLKTRVPHHSIACCVEQPSLRRRKKGMNCRDWLCVWRSRAQMTTRQVSAYARNL